MKSLKHIIIKNSHVIILIIVVFLAIKDLFHPGLLPTHDGEYHIIRFYEFDRVLRSGFFYPRWAPDLNNAYGIPLFNYVYPLPNYIASLIHDFGASFIDSFKISMIVATTLSTIGMFLFSRTYFGKWGGVLSATFYTFAPYRFVDIYVRGSIGEVWSLTFLPFLLFFITKAIKEKKVQYFWIASLTYAFLTFSHNILAVMFSVFICIYSLFLLWQEKRLEYGKYILAMILLGVGLCAIFWLPALIERKYVEGLQVYDVTTNFPEVYQLLIPSWGSGFSSGSIENQMSFQIGAANVLVIVLVSLYLVRSRKRKLEERNILLFFIISFIISIFFLLRLSEPLWKVIPFFNYFQFPWRFLSLIIFVCSFLAGFLAHYKRIIIPITLGVCAVLFSYSYAKAPFYHQRDDNYYTSRDNFIYSTNSPGNTFNTLWMNRALPKLQSRGVLSFERPVTVSKYSPYILPIAYFPGWNVLIDKKPVSVTHDKNGLLLVHMPKGTHNIAATLSLTNVQLLGTIISGLSFIMLLLLCFQRNLSTIVRRL